MDGTQLKLLTNNIKEYLTFNDFIADVSGIPEGRYLIKSDINNAGLPQEYYVYSDHTYKVIGDTLIQNENAF